jgi:hypothetical protein
VRFSLQIFRLFSSASKIALEFYEQIANKPIVLAPLLLGYVVGAVGIYSLLYKISPVVTDDHVTQSNASGDVSHVEIIELFPAERSAEQSKAA